MEPGSVLSQSPLLLELQRKALVAQLALLVQLVVLSLQLAQLSALVRLQRQLLSVLHSRLGTPSARDC